MDPCGAQEKVLEVANSLGLSVSVAVAHEIGLTKSGSLGHIRECQNNENFLYNPIPSHPY